MTDFHIQPILGFRTWRLSKDPLALKALAWNCYWPKRKPLVSAHVSSSKWGPFPKQCGSGHPCESCGIWAFHSYCGLECHSQPHGTSDEVRGIVAGWGPVHLCSRGWRAGKAYPLALFEPETPPHLAPNGIHWHYVMYRLARQYGIPIISTADEVRVIIEDAGVVPAEEFLQLPRDGNPWTTWNARQTTAVNADGVKTIWYENESNWRVEIERSWGNGEAWTSERQSYSEDKR